jgi:hypothetical protein
MAVLDWIGKPVIVLLNQTGRPRPRDEEQADEARWRSALGSHPTIRQVTTLDAFARCWVQEIALFDLVRDALPEARRAPFGRLADAWQARRLAQFDEAMVALAAPIAYAACDREPLPDAGVGGALRGIGRSLGIGRDDAEDGKTRAASAMAARLDDALRASTDRLIALHGLDGSAKGEVLARLAAGVSLDAPVDERKAAMMGGVVSGAFTGCRGPRCVAVHVRRRHADRRGPRRARRRGHRAGLNLARGKRGGAALGRRFPVRPVVALLRTRGRALRTRPRDWTETEYSPFWPPIAAEAVERRRTRSPGCGRGASLRATPTDRPGTRVAADATRDADGSPDARGPRDPARRAARRAGQGVKPSASFIRCTLPDGPLGSASTKRT